MKEKLERLPVVGTALATNDRYTADLGNHLAAAIAFFGFLSLFPLALVGLSVAGFVLAGDPQAEARVVDAVAGAVPGLEAAVGGTVETLVRRRTATGVVGFVLVLFAGLRVVDAASLAVSRIFRIEVDEGVVKRKARTVVNLAVLGVLAVLAASAGSLAGVIGAAAEALGIPEAVVRLRGLLALALAFALDFALFLVAYRILVAGRGPSWRALWPGAALAALGWSVLKVVGAAYVGNTAAGWDALYGTLGALIGAMLLLFLGARIFVYGAELNAVLSGLDDPRDPDRARTERDGLVHSGRG